MRIEAGGPIPDGGGGDAVARGLGRRAALVLAVALAVASVAPWGGRAAWAEAGQDEQMEAGEPAQRAPAAGADEQGPSPAPEATPRTVPEAKPQPEAEPVLETPPQAEPEPGPAPEAEATPAAKPRPELEPEPQPDVEPPTVPEANSETKPEAQPEPVTGAVPEEEPEAEAEAEAEAEDGPPARAVAEAPPVEAGLVAEVRFEGNVLVEPELLRDKVATRSGDRVDPDRIREDVKALWSLGSFEDVEALAEEGPEGIVVTFRVKENPVVKEVRVEGNDKIEETKIREVILVKHHAILNPVQVRESLRRITALYEAQGYTDAIVRDRIEPAGRAVSVVFRIQENEEVYITEIRLEGMHHFRPEDLSITERAGNWVKGVEAFFTGERLTPEDVMETKEKWFLSWLTDRGLYKKDMLQDDVARLSIFYYNNGFVEHKIGEPRTEFTEDGVVVTIPIEEGEQYTIGSVALGGDLVESEQTLRDRVSIEEGEVFNRDRIRQDIFSLSEVYADHGYAFVDVEPVTRLDREERTVDLNYRIAKGKKAHFRRILIKGNENTRDKVIRREMRVLEGDLYSGSRLRLSKQRLERLGYFEEINFREDRGVSDEEIDLTVQVKEARTGTLSAGAGFSSLDAFVFNVRFTEQNFLGRGQTFVANVDIGSRRQLYDLSFTEPWLLDIPLLASVSAYRDERLYPDFARKSTGGSTTLGYPIYEFVDGSASYEFRRVEITDVDSGASSVIQDAVGSSNISSVILGLKRTTLNSRLDPTRGSLSSASIETASSLLGGDTDYLKLSIRTTWYLPMGWGVVFSPTARFGYGMGYGGDDELPLFERFFPGGLRSVRGYQDRSLGPLDPITGEVIGGNKEVIFNSEILFPIVQKFGLKGVLFADAGEAFGEGDSIDFDKLRTGVGFGFRWLSPLGLFRIEVGYPLKRRAGESASEVHFWIGGPI